LTGLGLLLVMGWVVLVAGVRGAIQYRRTGTPAMRVGDPRGTPQWWSRVVSTIGFVLLVGAGVAQLAGLPPIDLLDRPLLVNLGLVLYALGIVLTMGSQAAMGDAWRGDVDPGATGRLVTEGPFLVVRNPTLLGSAITLVGLVLVMPNLLALAALVCSVLSIQIQVRLVEEPYLLRVHGDEYRRYAARTGRFLPGIGRLHEHRDAPITR
jgi:protein-S-isoprenylcysteine O-methyltransferase Ste14